MEFNKKLLDHINLSSKDKIKGLTLPNKITVDLAYLCSIFAGDGSIYKRESKHDYILKVVGNPKDEQKLYHEVIGPCFEKVFGFLPGVKYQDTRTTYGFVVYSKALYQYLVNIIKLPSGRKYSSLAIPPIFKKDKKLLINFIRGVFDTDGSISFKKRYKTKPYYPVINLSSRSRFFIEQIAFELKKFEFKIVEIYDYNLIDIRVKKGFTTISSLSLNGKDNLKKWLHLIGFFSPKHLGKISKYFKEMAVA